MEDLSNLMSLVRTLVSTEGNSNAVTAEQDRTRLSRLKQSPHQQKLFTNVLATRLLCEKAGIDITQSDKDSHQTTEVEDLFLELAFGVLPKVVNCLLALQESGIKEARKHPPKPGSAPVLPPDTLGARDTGNLRSLLQFIVALGIHPFLGLQLRPDAAKYMGGARQISILERHQKMMSAVRNLRYLRQHRELIPLLRADAVHCAALAVLIEQVVYKPNDAVAEDEAEKFRCLQKQALIWLEEFIESALGPPLVSQLFYLHHVAQRSLTQSTGDKSTSAQRFRDECGRRLSAVAMLPGCVLHVLRAVLATRYTDSIGPELFKVLEMLARALCMCPQQSTSPGDYYDSVIEQLLQIAGKESMMSSDSTLRLGAVYTLKSMSRMNATEAALNKRLYLPIRVFYERAFADSLPSQMVSFCGDVIVSEAQLVKTIKLIHTFMTVSTGNLHFRLPSSRPLVVFFCIAATLQLTSPVREQALEILCSAVLQNSNPVDVMFTFVNSPDQVLLPSVMFVPTKGHVVRRSDMSASSPWSDELREVWPPGMSLLNPSIVNIMDLLVERAKDKPAAGSKNGSTSEPDLPTPASDVAWNRKSTGANVVRMMLTRCLVDLTRSLRGRPANEPTTTNSTFLEAGVDVDPKVTQQLEGDFVRLNLIATTSERYGPDILPKTDEVMNFIAHGLAAAAFVLDPSKANAKVLEEASSGPGKGMLLGQFGCWTINIFAAQVWSLVSVQLCLALLSNQLEIDTSFVNRELISRIMPSLRVVTSSHPEEQIRQHCQEVQIAAATYSTISTIAKNEWSGSAELLSADDWQQIISSLPQPDGEDTQQAADELSKQPAKASTQKSSVDHKKRKATSSGTSDKSSTVNGDKPKQPLIQELPSGKDAALDTGSSTDASASSESIPLSDDLKQAFKELRDPLLPVQGHGLQMLVKLLSRRDPSAVQRVDTLADIFVEQLAHHDSYIYLAAVNGLVALADVKTSLVVPRLCMELANSRQQQAAHTTETRLVLCEAISKVARLCGPLLPHYRRVFLNSLLAACRDNDALVRSAALSCLADVVGLLRFSLGTCLQEVLSSLSSVLQSDPEDKPRQAASLALKSIVMGLGPDLVKATGHSAAVIFRRLRDSATDDSNEHVRGHCCEALDSIYASMRESILPSGPMTKTIHVLRPPSS